MITKKQFSVLETLAVTNEKMSQRTIASSLSISIGNANHIISELTELGYMKDGSITDSGLEALEPYRVKRAILIAAGFGSRMVPITLNTPKPLVRVNGKRIIDSLLDAIVAADIDEVYIIRGYLGEQFDQLLYKYPNIKFIENKIYNESNNISSLLAAGDLLERAYVSEADLLLYNPKIIKKYQYCSNYIGVPVDETDDWCFETDSKNVITKLKLGGVNCYHMFGISYWDGKDGKQLFTDIKKVFDSPGGKERYWDQVPLEFCADNYKVEVRRCTFDDLTEIDTFNELKKLDKTYDV